MIVYYNYCHWLPQNPSNITYFQLLAVHIISLQKQKCEQIAGLKRKPPEKFNSDYHTRGDGEREREEEQLITLVPRVTIHLSRGEKKHLQSHREPKHKDKRIGAKFDKRHQVTLIKTYRSTEQSNYIFMFGRQTSNSQKRVKLVILLPPNSGREDECKRGVNQINPQVKDYNHKAQDTNAFMK